VDDETDDQAMNIVVLQADDRQFGLVVEGVTDTEEIVVKPLGKQLKGIPTFAGATIMGDGRLALILDVLGLAQRARVVTENRDRAAVASSSTTGTADDAAQSLVVLRVGDTGRVALPLSSVARLEEFERTRVEHGSGQDVVQYRGEILPLVDVARALGLPAASSETELLQVVVHTESGRSVGLVVEEIVDIVQEHVSVAAVAARKGLLGSAVVQGRVTDLLDAQAVIAGQGLVAAALPIGA
jgi:two-component system chemotaxis sensor kinase CheA